MQPTRLHALDAIRGIALLLGLVLHGSMSFWPGLEQYGFPISDGSKSMTLTWLFYVLHMFRMAVFFLIAGFFAHLTLARKGTREFLKSRMKRIALPLIVAWVVSLVLILPTVLWAAGKLYGAQGIETMTALQESAPPGPVTMHFWFLYYLLWFCIIAAGCATLLRKLDPAARMTAAISILVRVLCQTRLLVVLTAAVSAWVFYTRDNWIYWAGIPTPTEALWREAPAFVIYGMAFFVGWYFDRERECLAVLKSQWQHYLVLATLLTAYSLLLLNPQPFSLPGPGATGKGHFAGVYALASWCWVFAFIGIGMKFFDRESALGRYIADASYWVYIAHIPVIFFLQTLLMDVPLHWLIKFPVILGVTTAVTFWTYEKWVRYTVIGNVLNGVRLRPQTSPATAIHG